MKKIIFAFAMLLFINGISAQVLKKIGDKAKQKTEQRANDKIDKAMDEGLDKVEESTKTKKDSDGDVKTKEEDGTKNKKDADGDTKTKTADGSKQKAEPVLSYNSKYDFVPGEKLIAYEDFSSGAIGDFPAKWNTNASAEIVSLNNKEGKWLKINKEGIFLPEFIKDLPDNFTLEFDLGVNNGWDSKPFIVNIANLARPEDYTDYGHYVSWRGKHAVHLEFAPHNGTVSAWSRIQASKDGNYTVNNTIEYKVWDNTSKNFGHISLWRQNQRLRVYLNGEKIWDVPKAFDAASKYNAITFAMQGSYNEADYFVLNNIRLAVGAPDTRNKLLTEGKFVTRGILFDVNSDKIKPESYGALKDIGNVLKENAAIKVRIVGHTDSDGDDKANLSLSEKRAAAVKSYLVNEFGISADNLSTEGKGESQPVDKNTTSEGKANNRRVEFIKL